MVGMIGSVVGSCLQFAPQDWAYCAGQTLAISQFTSLFSIIGTQYGGDGRVTFRLPDFQGRVPLGEGQSPGTDYYQNGMFGGLEWITLSEPYIPVHSHSMDIPVTGTITNKAFNGAPSQLSPENSVRANIGQPVYASSGSANVDANEAVNALAVDGDTENAGTVPVQSFSNTQPWGVMHYLICVDGYYPPRN